MPQNIDIAISNVEESEVLTAKAEQMSLQSNKFLAKSKQAKRQFCLQDLKVRPQEGVCGLVWSGLVWCVWAGG